MKTQKFEQQKCKSLPQDKPRKLMVDEMPAYGFPCGCIASRKKLKSKS